MKKILFIVNAEKISPNINGGGAVLYSHLELLHGLGYEVVLLAVVWSESYSFQESDYEEVQEFVSEIVTYKVDQGKRKRGLNWVYHALFKPTEFEYFFVNGNNQKYLQTILKEKDIDLVWCEWRWAAIWAMKTPLHIPKIYSHHDWEYKLALLRKKPTFNKRFHTFQKKRVEMQLVKQMNACVSGSQTEADEIQQISRKQVLYLPTTYKSLTPKLSPKKNPSIVHLGGMGTTANRIGLERFLDVCWKGIKSQIPNVELIVVGSIKRAKFSLQKKLEDAQIKTLGFVEDLDEVLHPQDIHIIPWEHNTGTRTRIPVALNYEQALVTMRDSAKCYPEITEENAILCHSLEQMKEAIIHLYSNTEKLHLLTSKGKQTFIENYTLKRQLKRLKTFLNQVIGEKND
jgi:glycosyltransferase involved in cell wall biosynthesis